MTVTGTAGVLLLVARVLFGGTIAFMGLNHFMNPGSLIPYAESKDVPAPTLAVYGSGAALTLGGLSVLTGAFVAVGAVLLAAFFLVTTPLMHDFWAVPEDQKQNQMTQFLKNTTMFGASLGFLSLSFQPWAYSVGVGIV